MALVLDAPAKLNLHLAVLGRRADGYHEVDTVMHPLALCDTLYAEASGIGVQLQIGARADTGLAVAADGDNLVCRAARALLAAAEELGMASLPGVRFLLHKRIPAGGGLGGGSSDAAAALRLLNRLFQVPLPASHLHQLAAALGADVPFFLAGGSQRGRGVGSDLTPLPDIPRRHFVLILPTHGTSTPAVYQNLAADLTTRSSAASIPGGPEVSDFDELALPTGFRNDLESSAIELHPDLATLRRDISAAGFPQVRLSGSGSTFFLTLKDHADCVDAMASLASLRRRHGFALVQTESSSIQLNEPQTVPFPRSSDN